MFRYHSCIVTLAEGSLVCTLSRKGFSNLLSRPTTSMPVGSCRTSMWFSSLQISRSLSYQRTQLTVSTNFPITDLLVDMRSLHNAYDCLLWLFYRTHSLLRCSCLWRTLSDICCFARSVRLPCCSAKRHDVCSCDRFTTTLFKVQPLLPCICCGLSARTQESEEVTFSLT